MHTVHTGSYAPVPPNSKTVCLMPAGTVVLRAASPKYQLDLEIAKKSNFFKLAQNEALCALVTKISF